MKKRQLAAILFADIVGYTALMQKDETTASILLKRFQYEMETKVAEHKGQIINFYGDGALCTFQNPLEAMRCAMEIQTAFREVPKVPLRIGIHSGTVVFEGGKIYGDSVNLSSRIESMGISGGILFSKQVRDELKNQPDLQMQLLGEFEFKNVEEPMEIFALANEGFPIPKRKEMKGKLKTKTTNKIKWLIPMLVATLLAVAGYFGLGDTKNTPLVAKTIPSIAVLPFNDMSPAKDQEYFADGIAEEILNNLAQLKKLKVAGRTSSFSFKEKEVTIAEIGKALNVNNVLEGSIRKHGNKIRVTAQLIKVADGFHIWSDKYDREFDDIFAIQDELAQSIGTVLLKKLVPKEIAKLTSQPNQNSEVYALFLKAKHIHKAIYNSSQNIADFQKSEALFLQAIQLDSAYSPAHAGLADLYDSFWIRIPPMDIAEREKYLLLMQKESDLAIQLNPDLPYTNQIRGYVLQRTNNTREAFQHFLKSYQISPNNPEAIGGLSHLYLSMGLHNDALQFAERTVEIDPLFREGLIMKIFCNFFLGNEKQVIAECQSFLDIEPNNLTIMSYLFRSYFQIKNKQKALATWERMEQIDASFTNKLGLDLEIALLREDKTYIAEIKKEENHNYNFNIHDYYGSENLAEKEFQLATEEYIENVIDESSPQGSMYLDFYNNNRLKKYHEKEWFQKMLTLEKKKYDYLANHYPRAEEILGMSQKN